jgi:hypothetical protein
MGIQDRTLSELCSSFVTNSRLTDSSERNIIEFAEAPWGLGMGATPELPPLFPAQKFIFKCIYNIPLLDNDDHSIIIKDHFNEKERFRFNEMEYLNYLWNEGRINVKEITGQIKDTRPNTLLAIGRRGLKTSSIAILVAYETYKLLKRFSPQVYYKIMPDDEIRISCIATSKEQASELFRRITGHLDRSEFFKRYRCRPTLDYMQLSTERDLELYGNNRPSLRIVAAPCSGRTILGHNNIIAIIDEMAHFFEAATSDDKSDYNVYEAVTPSVAKFNSPEGEPQGRVICISSPYTRSGKFYDLYQRASDPDCNDLLMIQAPTWEIDYTLAPKYLRAKYIENPITFDTEFGAQFSDRVSSWIENEQVLKLNVIPGLKLKSISRDQLPHFMGVDIGMKNDGTAVVICHIIRQDTPNGPRDCIEIDCAEVRYAEKEGKEYFQPEELGEWLASFVNKFFIIKGVMDQYYGYAIIPVLHELGVKQVQAVQMGRDFNSKIYQNLMSKMLGGTLRIPEGEDHIEEGHRSKDIALVSELLKLQAVRHSKYLIEVQAPEAKGLHDDLSDAFARAVYLATEYLVARGGVVKQSVSESAGPITTFKRYARKAAQSSFYTNRPSSSMMSDAARARIYGPSRYGRV